MRPDNRSTNARGSGAAWKLLEDICDTYRIRDQGYGCRKLQGSGMKPLNWKLEPTAMGWSDTTRTVKATLVMASGTVCGMTQVTFRVLAEGTDTVALPVSPG